MTPVEVLIPGAVAIVFVVTWFVFGLIDATRDGSTRENTLGARYEPVPQPARDSARGRRR